MKQVPFFPWNRLDPVLLATYTEHVRSVLSSGVLQGHPCVAEFEEAFAAWTGSKGVVALASGSVALAIGLRAIGAAPGAEAVTSPFTYQATAAGAVHAGLVPRFADIDRRTLQLDDRQAEAAIGANTGVLLRVHLIGSECAVPGAVAAARRRGVAVVDDSAQRLVRGAVAGSAARLSCFSLGPTKNVAGFTEAGALASAEPEVLELAGRLRRNGSVGSFLHLDVGYNAVMNAVTAAVLSENLRHLDAWNRRREEIACRYDEHLRSRPQINLVARVGAHSPSKYCILVREERDALMQHLARSGVETEIHYPTPLHLQPCFRHLQYARGDFPVSERVADEVLSLPMHHVLDDSDVEYVCAAIHDFFDHR